MASPVRADPTYPIAVATTDVVAGGVFVVGTQVVGFERRGGLTGVPVLLGGLFGMALGAPIIHGLEGNYGRMGISVAARVTLPTIGFIATIRARSRNAIIAGFMTGYVVATIIDVAMASFGDGDPSTARTIGFGGRF